MRVPQFIIHVRPVVSQIDDQELGIFNEFRDLVNDDSGAGAIVRSAGMKAERCAKRDPAKTGGAKEARSLPPDFDVRVAYAFLVYTLSLFFRISPYN